MFFLFGLDVLPDKQSTSELLRRKMAGLPLEEPENGLVKRGKGKWKGEIGDNRSRRLLNFIVSFEKAWRNSMCSRTMTLIGVSLRL